MRRRSRRRLRNANARLVHHKLEWDFYSATALYSASMHSGKRNEVCGPAQITVTQT